MKQLFAIISAISGLTVMRYEAVQPTYEGTLPPHVGFAGIADITKDPVIAVSDKNDTWIRNGIVITQLAKFEGTGAILDLKHYDDKESVLSPFSVSIAWGPMLPQMDKFEWRSKWRGLEWSTEESPLLVPGEQVIKRYTGTLHIIPRDEGVYERLKDKQPGERVYLVGYIVQASGPHEFQWNSAVGQRTKKDPTEILWLEDVR